jgi:folate-binding protein YgfZ
LRAGGGFFPLGEVARFSVTGSDRLRYLNGQVSNDLRKLAPGCAMRACILSAKGKLDAVVWIWSEDDRLVVEGDASLAEPLAMRLERYVVADDVEITPLPALRIFHVFGRAAEGLSGLNIPRLGVPGLDLASEIEPMLLKASPDDLEILRIEHGLPRWGSELGPDTLPAEAGLDVTAVDFYKGCYIGQEVVSRIRSVGHANRALRIFDLVEGGPPAVGAKFFAPGETSRPVAIVTSIHFALSSAVGLCYIKRGTAEGAVLESTNGPSRIQLRQPECALPS